MKKKVIAIFVTIIGLFLSTYAAVNYNIIANNFVANEMKFINGSLDTVLIVVFTGGALVSLGGIFILIKSFITRKILA